MATKIFVTPPVKDRKKSINESAGLFRFMTSILSGNNLKSTLTIQLSLLNNTGFLQFEQHLHNG